MIDVKISLASHGKNLNFKNFINPLKTYNINFHINSDLDQADYWFVFEDLDQAQESCYVPKENVFYFNNETSYQQDYFFQPYLKKYLNQFKKTFSSYANDHPDNTYSPPFLPWMIHGNHGDSIYNPTELNYSYLSSLKKLDKQIDLSVICSNKSQTENHSLRLEFVKILKNYFGDNLVWCGNGINPVEKKSDLIFKSKYHLVIENNFRDNVFSEKIFDSFLGLSVPIYCGAPNIHDYFKKNSLIPINIYNINEAINKIESAINSSFFEKNFSNLLSSRDIVLGDLNLINRLISIIENNQKETVKNKNFVVLNNVEYFWKRYSSNKKKVKKYLKRSLRIN